MVGENNAGKSNIITALRLFYEYDIKFTKEKDFPKFSTDDNESWIEIEYCVSDEEYSTLKEEYKRPGNHFRVRRYFTSADPELVDPKQSNIYAYEKDILSKNLFYGAKNPASAKLGNIIYIPELSKSGDNLKLSGPSPLREIAFFVFKKAVINTKAFHDLGDSLNSFNELFQSETTSDEFSLNGLVSDINEQINNWGIRFGFRIGSLKPEDIVKNLLSHYIQDNNLKDAEIDIDNLGQGVQRHIIYTLIRLASKYVDKKDSKKKEFSPDLSLILFEEPEAFLHPTQQELLNISFKELRNDSQILITTHSSTFVSRNIDDFTSIIKLTKNNNGVTQTRQLVDMDILSLLATNIGLYMHFSEILQSSSCVEKIRKTIKDSGLGQNPPNPAIKMEEEAFKYFLWLDAERSSLFFAKHVIICEGATEKAFLGCLLDSEWIDIKRKQIYILDSMGKYNIHKFMNLFGKLGIKHSVLFDGDDGKDLQQIVNDYIVSIKNEYTIKIDSFEVDIETFLGITPAARKDLKPANVLLALKNGMITNDKLESLKHKINELINIA